MKKLAGIISLLFVCISAYCQQPFIQKLDDTAQVTFPGVPKTVIRSGKLYIYKDSSAVIYMAQVSKLDKGLQDLLNNHLTDSVYNAYVKGLLGSSNATLVYREPVTAQGLKGVNFGYKINAGGNSYWCYHHVFYAKDMLLTYSYWSPDSLSKSDPKIAAYFHTFKLLVDPAKLQDNNSSDVAYKLGTIVGKAAAIGSMLFIIAAIVFLIIYFSNKKKKNNNMPPPPYAGP